MLDTDRPMSLPSAAIRLCIQGRQTQRHGRQSIFHSARWAVLMLKRYSDHAANERTFLAWVHTSFAVMAFGS